MELFAEGLFGGLKGSIGTLPRVGGKDGRSRKAKEVIVPEILYDLGVHVSKLGTMAFIKNDDDLLLVDLVCLVPRDKELEFLDGRNDDLGRRVFELML
jgi:hypothetical protein